MKLVPALVSRNWRLKLASFGLAVFLWGVARAEPGAFVTQTVSDVPVFAEVSGLDWAVAGEADPPTVDVRVTGSVGSLALGRALTVQIPIDEVVGTDTVVQLQRDWVQSLDGVPIQVEDVNPQQVALSFERIVPGAVPLSLRVEGRLSDDLALAQPLTLTPEVVRVRGRESRLAELDSIALEPLDLGSISRPGNYTLQIDTTAFGDLNFFETEATVDVRLGEATVRVVDSVGVTLDSIPPGQSADEYTFDPPVVSVTLRGERTRVEQVRAEGLRALLRATSASSIPPGGSSPVAVHIDGVPELVEAEPSTTLVEVSRAAEDAGGGVGGDAR